MRGLQSSIANARSSYRSTFIARALETHIQWHKMVPNGRRWNQLADARATTLPVATHIYIQQNAYNVTLVVKDDFGVPSSNTQQVTVHVIIVPEFPSSLILPLFITATLLAAIVWRRKHRADSVSC